MEEAVVTALLWLGFGGTHVGLTLAPIRKRLVGALGEGGHIFVYTLVAIATFGALVHYVALHRHAGPQTSLLVTIPPVHGALLAISVLGFSLFVTSNGKLAALNLSLVNSAVVWAQASALISEIITVAPASAKANAIWRPMPRAEPVIKAILSLSIFMD